MFLMFHENLGVREFVEVVWYGITEGVAHVEDIKNHGTLGTLGTL